MKFRWFFLGVLFLAASASAQEVFVQGELRDARNNEPVVFATVRVKGRALGVISNLDGSFRIPQRFKDYSDTLEISSMGYKTREVLISSLPVDGVRLIFIEPAFFKLQEAVVEGKRRRRFSARTIVKRAIENISKNYPMSPFSSVGYYRDYQLKDSDYINLNEAILEVYDMGFTQSDEATSKVRIYEYKQNPNFERDTLADNLYDYRSRQKIMDNAFLSDYHGNEFSILRIHDAIRNYNLATFSFIEQLDEDLLVNHSFSRDGSTYLDEEPLYKIQFRKKQPGHQAVGTLYISYRDFAIHKLQYAVYSLKNGKSRKTANKHGVHGELLFEVLTEYRKNSGKMYPHYISFHNRFQLLDPDRFRVTNVYWNQEKKRFEFLFNGEPREEDAKRYRNYSIKYKGNKIRFRAVVNYENQVWLYPKKTEKTIDRIEQLVKSDQFKERLLTIKVKNIRDTLGNVVNELQYKTIDQYREFFVQQIKPTVSVPTDIPFMDKKKPIFKDQPINRPANFDDYWMNTPLKNLE